MSIEDFRQAVDAYENEVSERTGTPRSYGGGRNEKLADALDGLDLSAREWHLMKWFLSWDCQDELAAIIVKAREQGMTKDPATRR